jgi:hypothetical protein
MIRHETSHIGDRAECSRSAYRKVSEAAYRMGVLIPISKKHRLPKVVSLWRAGKLKPETMNALSRDPQAVKEFRRQQRRENRNQKP